MNTLFILNDSPRAMGRCYNGLRIASTLSMRSSQFVRIFLVGDAIACARPCAEQGDTGSQEVEELIRAILNHGGEIAVCDWCLSGSSPVRDNLIEGTEPHSLDDMANWMAEADHVLVF